MESIHIGKLVVDTRKERNVDSSGNLSQRVKNGVALNPVEFGLMFASGAQRR